MQSKNYVKVVNNRLLYEELRDGLTAPAFERATGGVADADHGRVEGDGASVTVMFADDITIASVDAIVNPHVSTGKSESELDIVNQGINGAKVVNGAALTISDALATFASLDTPIFNDGGLVWQVANPTRLTALHAGRYFALAGVIWDTNALGDRTITLLKNGVDVLDRDRDSGPGEAEKRQMVGSYIDMVKDDYVELRVNQTSGGDLGIAAEKCALSLNRAV